METQFKKGVIEICVLQEIKKEDTYGYSLVKKLADILDIGESTIYTMLRKLTKEGYLEVYTIPGTDGPRRKYYKISDFGRDRLYSLRYEWRDFINRVEEVIGGDDE